MNAVAVDTITAAEAEMRSIETMAITPSPTNPRRDVGGPGFDDLVASVRAKGILQPILVRPIERPTAKQESSGTIYQIVAGHRRYAAAREANLAMIPCVVRTLDDKEVLEIQVIENLQRRDLTALEEAEGYRQLITKHGYTAERIAEKIGMSLKYVYDRVKLLDLTKGARELLLSGRITAGHAILLARLKPEDQARAISPDVDHYNHRQALFDTEYSLFTDDREDQEEEARRKDPYVGLKARSVRELQAWIDKHVRFRPTEKIDPMLFPETAAAVSQAVEAKDKVVQITHDYVLSDQARDAKVRTYTERSWKRADSSSKAAPACEYSVLGVVVAGPGRGEAFDVCVNKDKCETHWGKEMKERKRRASGAPAAVLQKEQRLRERDEKRQRAEQWKRARFEESKPKILEALAGVVKKTSTSSRGPLGQLLLGALSRGTRLPKELVALVPVGRSAEDLIRHLAILQIWEQVDDAWRSDEVVKLGKAFRVDVAAIIKAVTNEPPAPGVQTSAQPESGTCQSCGCTDEDACEGGCSWVDEEHTKCSQCFPPARKAKKKK